MSQIESQRNRKMPFANLIQIMLRNSHDANHIADVDIPNAFPLQDAPDISDSTFHHAHTDYPSSSIAYTRLPDVLYVYDILEKLDGIARDTISIIDDLYPKRGMKFGSMEIDIKTDFSTMRAMLMEGIEKLRAIGERVSEQQSDSAHTAIDPEQLQKIVDFLTVLGWEYVHNDCELPIYFSEHSNIIFNRKALENIDRTFSPQVASFAKTAQVNVALNPKISQRTQQFIDQLRSLNKRSES